MDERGSPCASSGCGWLRCAVWVAAIAVSAVLLVANALLGELNQDEGWYLYAARLVSLGKLPYRDFAFTQGPIMALTYAAAQPLVTAYGLLGGRLFTVMLAVVCLVCTTAFAARLATPGRKSVAGLLVLILVGVNAYQSYFCSMPKTYSLAGALLMGGFLVLSFSDGRHGRAAAFAAGTLMALAAGTRITIAAAPVIACLWLLVRARDRCLLFAIGAGLTGCAVFLPFLVIARDGFVFCMVGYHAGREAGGGLSALLLMAGSLSRLLGAYSAAFTLLVAALTARLAGAGDGRGERITPPVLAAMPGMLWSCVAVTGLAHLLAPFPYDDYQVVLFPMLSVAIVLSALGVCAGISQRGVVAGCAAVLVVSLCAAASSPIAQGWVVGGKDRLWIVRREKSPVSLLRDAGRFVLQHANRGDELLTQDVYLAIETGMSVPHGFEMGQFSYFPGMSRSEAGVRGVLNGEMLRELLEKSEAPVAAFSGYGLSVRCPDVSELSLEEQSELMAIVEKRYEPMKTIESFGQAATTLRILRRKRGEE